VDETTRRVVDELIDLIGHFVGRIENCEIAVITHAPG
jgi:hypothetical protein